MGVLSIVWFLYFKIFIKNEIQQKLRLITILVKKLSLFEIVIKLWSDNFEDTDGPPFADSIVQWLLREEILADCKKT